MAENKQTGTVLSTREVKIAILGCGTVGSQVVRLLQEREQEYTARCGGALRIIGIAVNNLASPRPEYIPSQLLTRDSDSLIEQADLVIELIGGIEPAYTHIRKALSLGKTVVTGNKALLAQHGHDLFNLAREKQADLYYEAAVAGAVPVVYGLRESLAGDVVECVQGIVNGTTNYILDQMDTKSWSYEQALSTAQELGYAEADPTADVEGLDAAAKCALLAQLAFHTRVDLDQVSVRGISDITSEDIADANAIGRKIKLLAVAKRVRKADGTQAISARVEPVLVDLDNPISTVSGAFNAVVIDAEAAGRLMFYGQGAGGVQTASAVLGDVVAGAFHLLNGGAAPQESAYAELPVLPRSEHLGKYRIRLLVDNTLGVLATLAGIFRDQQVSISAIQQNTGSGRHIEIALSTDWAYQGNIDQTVAKIKAEPTVKQVLQVMSLEG